MPIALRGLPSLVSTPSLAFSARMSKLMNQCAFKHSARNSPLNDSMKVLSVGLPGREKSMVTPRWVSRSCDFRPSTCSWIR